MSKNNRKSRKNLNSFSKKNGWQDVVIPGKKSDGWQQAPVFAKPVAKHTVSGKTFVKKLLVGAISTLSAYAFLGVLCNSFLVY